MGKKVFTADSTFVTTPSAPHGPHPQPPPPSPFPPPLPHPAAPPPPTRCQGPAAPVGKAPGDPPGRRCSEGRQRPRAQVCVRGAHSVQPLPVAPGPPLSPKTPETERSHAELTEGAAAHPRPWLLCRPAPDKLGPVLSLH